MVGVNKKLDSHQLGREGMWDFREKEEEEKESRCADYTREGH